MKKQIYCLSTVLLVLFGCSSNDEQPKDATVKDSIIKQIQVELAEATNEKLSSNVRTKESDSIECCKTGLAYARGVLGTGVEHFNSEYSRLTDSIAIVVTGTKDDTEIDPYSFILYLQYLNDKWNVIAQEYITDNPKKRVFEKLEISFPDKYWDEIIRTTG